MSQEQAPEPLTDRVRDALAAQPSTREVRMFGKVGVHGERQDGRRGGRR